MITAPSMLQTKRRLELKREIRFAMLLENLRFLSQFDGER